MTVLAARDRERAPRPDLSVVRLLATGALSAGIVFFLCWLGTFVSVSNPTHAFISLFTTAPVGSVEALAVGLGWSLLFGALVGAVFALAYNWTKLLERRSD
jgi:hypothetical protein